MKKIILYILVAFIAQYNTYGQNADNSASKINMILQVVIKDMEDSNRFVIHSEAGIFSINNNTLTEDVKRELYTDGIYTVKMFTDPNISDFKLRIWKKTSAGDWIRVDSADRNNHASIKAELLGDKEEVVIEPSEQAQYAFQLVSLVNNNKTGRYGLILIKKDKDESPPPPPSSSIKFFSIETRKTCFRDANGKYNDCSTENETSLFEFNESETVLKHTTPTISSSYFVSKKVRDDEHSWYEYTLRSDAGNTYTMFLPDSHNNVIFFKDKGDDSYMVIYGVKRFWTE